jgi:hypothetical protein
MSDAKVSQQAQDLPAGQLHLPYFILASQPASWAYVGRGAPVAAGAWEELPAPAALHLFVITVILSYCHTVTYCQIRYLLCGVVRDFPHALLLLLLPLLSLLLLLLVDAVTAAASSSALLDSCSMAWRHGPGP